MENRKEIIEIIGCLKGELSVIEMVKGQIEEEIKSRSSSKSELDYVEELENEIKKFEKKKSEIGQKLQELTLDYFKNILYQKY